MVVVGERGSPEGEGERRRERVCERGRESLPKPDTAGRRDEIFRWGSPRLAV